MSMKVNGSSSNNMSPRASDIVPDDDAAAAATVQAKVESGPQPEHFLARGKNKFTPLIPLDELPEWVTIAGLPLYVTFEELREWKAIACGPTTEKHQHPYAVTIEGAEKDEVEVSDHESINIPSTRTLQARLSHALSSHDEAQRNGLNQAPPAGPRKATPFRAYRQHYNPTTPGVLGRKTYCTHWMRTGECDFTQQGCMFLHKMPDLDTLEALGFRAYPRWFREMARDFQIEHAQAFDEAGLDEHRLKVHHSIPARHKHGHNGEKGYPAQSYGFNGNGYGGDYGRYHNKGYGKGHGHAYGRGRGYGGWNGPAYESYNNFQASSGYSAQDTTAQHHNYGQSAWDEQSSTATPHSSNIWTPGPAERVSNARKQPMIPFAKPFFPGGDAPGNSFHGDGIRPASAAGRAETTPVGPYNDHSMFSRDCSPDSFINQVHRALSPDIPNHQLSQMRLSPGPIQRPAHRALNEGAPTTPSPVYPAHFQNKPSSGTDAYISNASKTSANPVRLAPDAKVSGLSRPPITPATTHEVGRPAFRGGHHRGQHHGGRGGRFLGHRRGDSKQNASQNSSSGTPGVPTPVPSPGIANGATPPKATWMNRAGNDDAESLMDMRSHATSRQT